jgi:hypothetical protein
VREPPAIVASGKSVSPSSILIFSIGTPKNSAAVCATVSISSGAEIVRGGLDDYRAVRIYAHTR